MGKLKIGEKVNVSMSSYGYDADGLIIGETIKCWRVKITNHKTFGELWKEQEEEVKLFYKSNLMNRGFSRDINMGAVTQINSPKP